MIRRALFVWLQGSAFYRQLHQEAVAAVPCDPGHGIWVDVGCGPGLVPRLAAERGYRAFGIDYSAQMIHVARSIARRERSPAHFIVGTTATLGAATAHVVSATSLLAVLPDPRAGLYELWRAVQPGGSLLIVEATEAMTLANARAFRQRGLSLRSAVGICLWAFARQGSAVNSAIYDQLDAVQRHYLPLLDGMVGAWVLRRSSSPLHSTSL